jgi:hypothetical protein
MVRRCRLRKSNGVLNVTGAQTLLVFADESAGTLSGMLQDFKDF